MKIGNGSETVLVEMSTAIAMSDKPTVTATPMAVNVNWEIPSKSASSPIPSRTCFHAFFILGDRSTLITIM
jgi:hypothetical protein